MTISHHWLPKAPSKQRQVIAVLAPNTGGFYYGMGNDWSGNSLRNEVDLAPWQREQTLAAHHLLPARI